MGWLRTTSVVTVHSIRMVRTSCSCREFVYNPSVSGHLGASSFDFDLGWAPNTQLDFIGRLQVQV